MLQHSRFGLAFTLMVIGLAISTLPLQGQTISFFRQFTTTGIDRATAVAADASGIYVIGNRGFSQGGGVRKYDSGGNELWTREFSFPTLFGAAADATGVYVVGFGGTAGPDVLRKYSPSGDEVWTRELGFSPSGGVAVDAAGVYVAGRDFPPNSSYLRKYSPDGAELWTSQFGDRNNLDNVVAVAVDATGVYMLGIAGRFTPPVPSSFTFVRKWDFRGNDLWTRQLYPDAVPSTFAVAAPTGFYVVATEQGGCFLRKYNSGGDELWSRGAATSCGYGPTSTGPPGVVADATGVYVVGTSTSLAGPALPGQCRSGSGGDSFIRKYDPDGAELWTRQFGTADAAWASGVALDASGVYVVGGVSADAFRDAWELAPAEILENLEPGSAFLAKFEKTAAVVTGSGPRIFPGCVVNAASYVGGGVAPGEIVTLFGSAMGPSERVPLRLTEDRRLATTLADTRILFNDVPAPLMYVSGKQSSAIVPYAIAGRTSVDVQVEYKGIRSDVLTVPVLASRPGIFSLDGSGQGQGEILNEDGSPNSPSNPAQRGSIVTLFATGGGEVAPGVEDGQILSDVLPRTNLPVSVFFDLGNNEFQVASKLGEVLYAGGVSGSVAGLLQMKVRVPANAVATGNAVPFLLIIGSHWTVYQVTVALR